MHSNKENRIRNGTPKTSTIFFFFSLSILGEASPITVHIQKTYKIRTKLGTGLSGTPEHVVFFERLGYPTLGAVALVWGSHRAPLEPLPAPPRGALPGSWG